MPSDEEVTQRAGSLRAMTGLTAQEVTALLPHFKHALAAYLQERTIDGPPRTSRRYSADDHGPWPTMADTRLFMLTYVKQHPLQEVQGQLVGMSPSNAKKWIHLLQAVLNHAWAHQERLPARTADDLAVWLRGRTDAGRAHVPPCWHDGTERPIHRPTEPEEQQEDYRGQKKCHTVNNLLVIEETCHICVLSDTDEGKAPEKSLADLAGATLPRGSGRYQDLGCQGLTRDGSTIIQSKKKPRRGELTPPEKAHHREISSIRIRIEHAIGGVKRDRIVKDQRRLLKDGIRDISMETCCGLHNFRLQYRPWHYAN